jgi:hypothetical protein
VFRSGSLLRVGESGSGNQRRGGHRHHQAIGHGISPHVFALPCADNERRCAMFRDIAGYTGFVL